MPWFVYFEVPGRLSAEHRGRIGLSVLAHLTREEAIAEVRAVLERRGYRHLKLLGAFVYKERKSAG